MRNSIEHFDDRLDEIAERSTDGAFEFPLLVISDVALGHENALAFLRETASQPKMVQHIRTYIADTATFHVFRWSFSVARIAECCEEMLERLGDGWVDPRTLTVHAGSLSFQPSRPTCSRKDSGYPL